MESGSRKRRASLPETGNSSSSKAETGNDSCDVTPEVDETSDEIEKRKRRVSESPTSEKDRKDQETSLSVTPSTSATLVKHRVNDERMKIVEMFDSLKKTINLLVGMCENHLGESFATNSAKSPSKSAESSNVDKKVEATEEDKDVEKSSKEAEEKESE